MTSPMNHKQSFPPPIHKGFQINPTDYGMIKSPCLCRPIAPRKGLPCSRAYKDKNDPACENCAVFKRGLADCIDPDNYVAPVVVNRDKRIKECGFPGCTNTTKGEHCRSCKNVVNSRKARWRQLYGDINVDPDWLYRPIAKDKAGRGQGRKKLTRRNHDNKNG